jgi:hypothetical protein
MGLHDEGCPLCGAWIDRGYMPLSHETEDGDVCEFGAGHPDYIEWLEDTVFCEECGGGLDDGPDGGQLVDIGDGYQVHTTCRCASCGASLSDATDRVVLEGESLCRECATERLNPTV